MSLRTAGAPVTSHSVAGARGTLRNGRMTICRVRTDAAGGVTRAGFVDVQFAMGIPLGHCALAAVDAQRRRAASGVVRMARIDRPPGFPASAAVMYNGPTMTRFWRRKL